MTSTHQDKIICRCRNADGVQSESGIVFIEQASKVSIVTLTDINVCMSIHYWCLHIA